MAGLSLSLLGPLSGTIDDRPLTGFRTRLAQALLIYLACRPEAHGRESLMALFWPDLPQTSAQQNLRQNLYYLRKVVPEVAARDGRGPVPLLLAEHDKVQLNHDAAVELDVRRFADLLERPQPTPEHLTEAAELYRGDFLADFYLPDSNPFEGWAAARREAYRRQVLIALERLTAIHLAAADYGPAERCARRQLSIDALHEIANRQLIEVLARSGHRSAALSHYEEYRHLLQAELAVEPGSATLALLQAVQSGELQPAGERPGHIRSYELREELGRGSFGVVHRAFQPAVGREVAIKAIPAQYADDTAFIRRFETEAQLIARLEHPQIVPLYDYWREPGGAYLVMRYLRGGNLRAALAERSWPLDQIVQLVDQLAAALHTAHRHGIVHCDVKPANILLDEEGNAYLSDFGIARLFQFEGASDFPAMITGTPDYVSPEQINNQPITPLSDQYSLGVVVYELLAGEPPFEADSILALLEKYVGEPFPSVHDRRSEVPGAVDEVLQRVGAKRPEERFADVLVFAEAFRVAVRGEMIQTGRMPARFDEANPYKGLLSFTETDADLFFGREAIIKQLLRRLLPSATVPADGTRSKGEGCFLAVVGPSGSGKSSLVRAGLVPALRQGAIPGSESWFFLDMIPGAQPFEEVNTALQRIAVDLPAGQLEQLQLDGSGLLRAVRRVLPADGAGPLLLIIDQFEELFTLVSDRTITARFLDSLYRAVTDPHTPLRIVITLRADFYDRPLLYPGFSELLQRYTEVVIPLTPDELLQAIERPAAVVGVRVEPELVAALIADINEQPGALPLLQHTLSELFDHREGDRLRLAAYRQLGGISGAISQRAEATYAQLDGAGRIAAQDLFLRLVTWGEGVEDTRRRVLRDELAALDDVEERGETADGRRSAVTAAVTAVIDSFGRARLLSFDRDPVTRGPTVEIAHEALLRAWPRLRGWVDESRAELRLARLLTQTAAEWVAAGHEDGFLLRGARLDRLASLVNGQVALTSSERRFLESSLAARDARWEAEEARRQEEIAAAQQLAETERQRAAEQSQAARRLRQRAVLLAGALLLALILALTALLFGRRARQESLVAESERAAALVAEATAAAEADVRATAEANARQQRAVAETQTLLATSRELTQVALNSLTTDAELSMLLALEALGTAETREAQEALHRALQTSRTLLIYDNITDIVDTPEGPLLVTVGEADITLRHPDTGDLVQVLPFKADDPEATYDVFVGRDGDDLLLLSWPANRDGVTIRSWKLDEGQTAISRTLPIQLDAFSGLTLSPDGQLLAVGYENGDVELWDIQTGRRLLIIAEHDDWVWSVFFDKFGRRLATVSPDGQVSIWDIPASIAAESGRQLASLTVPADFGRPKAFAFVDDIRVAIGTHLGWVQLWDINVGDGPLFARHGHNNVVHHLSLNRDRSQLVSGSTDGLAKIWDVTNGELLLTLDGSVSSVFRVHFDPDGTRLVTLGEEGTARLWDVRLQALGEVGSYTTAPLTFDLELSPEGKQLATGSEVEAPSLWNSSTGEQLQTLAGPEGGVFRVAYSPDGSRLAGVGRDNLIRVWDVDSGKVLLTIAGHGPGTVAEGLFSGTMDVAYSPDGARLATAGADGIAKVWDAQTGEELLAFTNHTAGLLNLDYSPDGRLIATTSYRDDGTVRVWDAQTGEERFVLRGHSGDTWALAFSPDSSKLVSGGDFGLVKVWSMATGEELYPLTRRTDTTFDVEFTPDGQFFVTAGDGLTLWRTEDGEEMMTILDQPVYFIAISPDGRRLYAVDIQDTVQVFALQLEDTIALAHRRLTRWWRPEECQTFLRTADCPAVPEGLNSSE